jgi:hypothetical protein
MIQLNVFPRVRCAALLGSYPPMVSTLHDDNVAMAWRMFLSA